VSIGTQIEVVMPQMGVSVSEGTITKWLKQVGDPVARDEPLLEISTDKVDTEVPSPGEGVVAQILVHEGDTVDVGTVLALIAPAGVEAAEPPSAEPAPQAVGAPLGAAPQPPAAPSEPIPEEAARRIPQLGAPEPTAPTAPQAAPAPPRLAPEEPGSGDGRTFVSPVVARIAAEHGVDPSTVLGTGTGGRVTKKDILGYIAKGAPVPAPATAMAATPPAAETVAPAEAEHVAPGPPPAPPAPAAPTPEVPSVPPPSIPAPEAVPTPPPAPLAAPPLPQAPAPTPALAPSEVEPALLPGEAAEPVTAMRRGIAEHMRRSLDTSAHVTSAIEVDMSRIVELRARLKPEFERSHGVKLTYLAFVARAAVETLADYPWINGEIRGDRIVTHDYVNLGFAVELADGKGLIVPVLRNAETLNLLGIAKGVVDIAQRARDKKLLPDEVQGGTFTITNPGGYGTFHGTPIISQPQAAILGTYAVVKRPWVVQDEMGQDVIAIRPIMNLTLTYDHRLVDGALAGRFLHDLRDRLESWDESGS
jgi:pyruvate dehydrogenase E2 component (dihydrolipoamide acetyltransferase)